LTRANGIGYDGITGSGNIQLPWEQAFGSASNGAFWHETIFDLSFVSGEYMEVMFDFGASAVAHLEQNTDGISTGSL
jgi:hypothetical protein